MGEQQLSHFSFPPFQILYVGSGNGNQQIDIVKVFIIRKTILQKVAAADSTVQIIEVGVGITGFLNLGTVYTELLSKFLHHALFWLFAEEQVNVNPVPGIDK